MMHFEVEAQALQRLVPFQLDLFHDRAFVTLVAFTMENLRPRCGGRLGVWLFKPVATHDFLNLRTYVNHHGETGIHFLAEWLSSWLAVQLGPATFGLPYRHGRLQYVHNQRVGRLRGTVVDAGTHTRLAYHGKLESATTFKPCGGGSLTEWLMERYTAFNCAGGMKRYFRIWHPPWPQRQADVQFDNLSLLMREWPLFQQARYAGANYSPGLISVWMGRPHMV